MSWWDLFQPVGLTRSMAAQARRQERIRESLQVRAAILSADATACIDQVAEIEERLIRKPLTGLSFRYSPNGWVADVRVSRGRVKCEFPFAFTPETVNYAPASIDVDGCVLSPLVCSINKYATYISFRVESRDGGVKLNLINQANPGSSRIALGVGSGETAYFPLEGEVDGPTFKGMPRVGSIAFAPFDKEIETFSILIGGEDGVSEIKVAGASILESTRAAQDPKTMTSVFAEQVKAGMESRLKRT